MATLSVYTPDMSPDNHTLSGTLTKTFDVSEGIAVFDDLMLDIRGRYSLYVEVTSTPDDYSLSAMSSVIEIASGMYRVSPSLHFSRYSGGITCVRAKGGHM